MTQTPKKSRRQTLEEFLAARPADAFARYGLAMECANAGDNQAAEENYKLLIAAHPDYTAGYYHYGQLLVRLGRRDEARAVLTSGVAATRRTGDEHARSEMEAAMGELG